MCTLFLAPDRSREGDAREPELARPRPGLALASLARAELVALALLPGPRVPRRSSPPVLQRGVLAAADRQPQGGGEEIPAVRGRDKGSTAAAAERVHSSCMGTVEASTDPMYNTTTS